VFEGFAKIVERCDIRGITEPEIDDFLDYVFRTSNLVPFVLRQRPSLPNPDNERILEAAVQCRAMIVTHDEKDFVGTERLGVVVRTPAEFLKMLGEINERQR
jgi:hypothetical protein